MGQQSTRKESKMTLQHPSSILHCIKPHLEWSLSQAQCMYYESYSINDNTCTIVVSCFKNPHLFQGTKDLYNKPKGDKEL